MRRTALRRPSPRGEWLTRARALPRSTFLGHHDVWNLATGALLERHALKLAASAAFLLHACGAVERALSSRHLALFLLATTVMVSVVVSLVTLFAYMATFDTAFLFEDIYGSAGLCVSAAVALVQHAPDAPLPYARGFTHRVSAATAHLRRSRRPHPATVPRARAAADSACAAQHLPVAIVASTLVLEFVFGVAEDASFAVLALPVSWAYLRFARPRVIDDDADLTLPWRGDWRDEFAFPMLFPAALRPPVSAVSAIVAQTVGKLSLFDVPGPPETPARRRPVRDAALDGCSGARR